MSSNQKKGEKTKPENDSLKVPKSSNLKIFLFTGKLHGDFKNQSRRNVGLIKMN